MLKNPYLWAAVAVGVVYVCWQRGKTTTASVGFTAVQAGAASYIGSLGHKVSGKPCSCAGAAAGASAGAGAALNNTITGSAGTVAVGIGTPLDTGAAMGATPAGMSCTTHFH